MKKLIAIASLLSVFGATTALAQTTPPKKTTKAVKARDLWVCPMQKEVIKSHADAGKGPIVAGRVVHFCCAGCGPMFNKMTAADQKKAVAVAVKLETASAK